MVLSDWPTALRLMGRKAENENPTLGHISPMPWPFDPNISCPFAGLVLCGVRGTAAGGSCGGRCQWHIREGWWDTQVLLLCAACPPAVVSSKATHLVGGQSGIRSPRPWAPKAVCPYPAAVLGGRTFCLEEDHAASRGRVQEQKLGGHLSRRLQWQSLPRGRQGRSGVQHWLCHPVNLRSVTEPRLEGSPGAGTVSVHILAGA